jgi:hypothetical protein
MTCVYCRREIDVADPHYRLRGESSGDLVGELESHGVHRDCIFDRTPQEATR